MESVARDLFIVNKRKEIILFLLGIVVLCSIFYFYRLQHHEKELVATPRSVSSSHPAGKKISLTKWKTENGRIVKDIAIEGTRFRFSPKHLGVWKTGMVKEPILEDARILCYKDGEEYAVLSADTITPHITLTEGGDYQEIVEASSMVAQGNCLIVTKNHTALYADSMVFSLKEKTIDAHGKCVLMNAQKECYSDTYVGSVYLDDTVREQHSE